MIKVLFVCLGNICRSPAGEGILRHLIDKRDLSSDVIVASCGIGDWHIGRPPDTRIRAAASERGIALNSKAKPFVPNYLEEFDYILAADEDILEYLYKYAKTPEQKSRIHYMTVYAKAYKNQAVPDPYYLGSGAFEQVLDILEDSCNGLLEEIENRLEKS